MTDIKNTHPAENQSTLQPPYTIRRKIGSTLYEVNIRFSQTSHESMDDKMQRLIRNEILAQSNQ